MQQVFPNIRFLWLCKTVLLTGFAVSLPAFSQSNNETVSTDNIETTATTSNSPPEASNLVTQEGQTPIMRLEATIRGNKEQPQVLTIVPWQLPVHQRINENTEWQVQVTQLNSIERNAFLRNLALVDDLTSASAPVNNDDISNDTASQNSPID